MTQKKNKNHIQSRPQSGVSQDRVLHKQEIQVKQSFSGPIPDPETLQQYASVEKSIPNRIVTMAEKEQDNATSLNIKYIEFQSEKLSGEIDAVKRGQWFSFLISLIVMIGGIFIIIIGGHITGLILTLSALSGLVYAFYRQDENPRN